MLRSAARTDGAVAIKLALNAVIIGTMPFFGNILLNM
jgi:hypothetical protein